MGRGDQLNRQINLLRMLETRGMGMSLAELADHLGTSERTIQRDLELLQENGFPVEYQSDLHGKKFWRMPHGFFKSGQMALSLSEVLSLHLAEQLLGALAGTHFADGLNDILSKIKSIVPATARHYFDEVSHTLLVRPFAATDHAACANQIRVIDQAIAEEHSVEVAYHSLWRRDNYVTRFDPYGLVLHLDELFAVGWSHRAGAVRVFKISRIQSATLTGQPFERPVEFDLGQFFRSSFGIVQSERPPIEIAVRFYGMAAEVVRERIWHDSQHLFWLPGEPGLFEGDLIEPDTLMATFRLSELIEFKRWLRGFGDQVEVIRPEWLRQEMQQDLRAALQRYADPV